MALYCLCGGYNAELTHPEPDAAVFLSRQMKCVKTGAKQFVKLGDNQPLKEHFPMVDLFRCEHCGTYIAKE